MIRYDITPAKLKKAIEKESSGWLAEAQKKTAQFRLVKVFNEPTSQHSWGKIKGVFMQLQFEKCAYCERVIGEGRIEHDLEHYRPKNAVRSWPSAKQNKDKKFAYDFATGKAAAKGYYLLAYNFLNYACACKFCNTSFKSSYFPVEAARQLDTDRLSKLKGEKPLLIFPLGTLDDDPQSLITFEGITPIPAISSGPQYRRARITIDFFDLDRRDTLRRERAQIIQAIWLAFRTLQKTTASAADRNDAQQIIDLALSPRSPHTNCAQSFYRLCQQDEQRAQNYKVEAQRIARL